MMKFFVLMNYLASPRRILTDNHIVVSAQPNVTLSCAHLHAKGSQDSAACLVLVTHQP
jgi:hypothetical protein